jgi:hypothetical protein
VSATGCVPVVTYAILGLPWPRTLLPTSLRISGVVRQPRSSHANFAPLTKLRGPLRIDLGGVERINSVGVRTWLDFVTKCESSGTQLVFERCSPAIVLQISMISNFMGHAQVASVLVPYLCGACGAEHLQLAAITRGTPVAVARSVPCPKCGTPMQLDELEDMYATLFAR